jgi:hypothetical protein
MDKPLTKNQDWDDCDFTDDDDMEDENTCECGSYKNARRKMCDQCLFAYN